VGSLTDNLASVNSSARVIDPQNDKGPSFLQGLAQIAETAVTGGSRLFERAEADNARTAASRAKAAEDTAKNAAALLAYQQGTNQGAFAPPPVLNPAPQQGRYEGPVPIDSSLEGAPPPPGTERAVNEVVRAQQAEDQGRAPSGSGRILLETKINELFARHPEQINEMTKVFREAGLDHFLFRARDTEEAIYDSQTKAELDGANTLYETAIKAGVATQGATFAEVVEQGRAIAHQTYVAEQAKATAEASRAATAEGRSSFEFNQKNADRDVGIAVTRSLTTAVQPFFNRITELAVQAGQNPNDQQTVELAFPELAAGVDLIINNHIAALRQAGAPPSAIEEAQKQANTYKQSFQSLMSGPLSQAAATTRAVTGISNQLQLDFAQSMPVTSGLIELLGRSAVTELAGGNIASILPAGMIAELKGEAANISGVIDTDEEKMSLAKMAALLRGKTGIRELTEAQALEAMPTLVTAAIGGQRDIAGNVPGANRETYFNANLNIMNAAMEIQPGQDTSSTRATAVATQAAFGTTARQAQLAFVRTNPEEGRILITAGRASSYHLYQGLKNRQLDDTETNNGLWGFIWDDTVKSFRPQLNERAARNLVTQRAQGGGTPITIDGLRSAGPPTRLNNHVNSLTSLMNYQVATAPFDDDFKGATPREVQLFMLNGTLPRSMQQAQEAGRTVQQGLQMLRTDLGRAVSDSINFQVEATQTNNPVTPPRGELQTTVRDRAERMGLPWGLVNRLVSRESTWDANAENTKTQARGLFQINDDRTDRSLDENINDGLAIVKESMQVAQRVLGRPPFDWETYVVHQQGNGGGGALLNPANANKTALEVLTQAYRGNSRLATQAIVGNGGNTSMTAAEFAQSIKRFFEG